MRFKFTALVAGLLGALGVVLETAPAAEAAAPSTTAIEAQTAVLPSQTASGRIRTRRTDAFVCDLYTHICVKFTRTETRAIASYLGPGLIGAVSWASYLCGKIPSGAGVVGCTAVVSIYAYLLDRSFNSAAANGKCVELHFPYTPVGGGFWWKTEGC